MKTLQKCGGFAALYLAAAYLIGMVLFLVVLDYPGITEPAQKVALLVDKRGIIFSTNLLMYVFFGVFLVVLSLALHDRLKAEAPVLMQVATALGIIWAGSLIASGMVSNAGIAPSMSLYATDPAQAALTWQGFEARASGLGNGNGEILGGVWTLLVSVAALRAGGLPKAQNILGLVVGAVGIIFSTNLLMYVFFGVFLVVLSLALHDRLKAEAPALMQVATALGIIWAGSLIASGMVSNAGIAPSVSLYATDPAQAALTWQGFEAVASGLGNGNGEILGGVWTLLVSVVALRARGLPKAQNILGLVVGAVGIISIFPVLTGLTGIFGLGQMIWFVWLGIVLLRRSVKAEPATVRMSKPELA